MNTIELIVTWMVLYSATAAQGADESCTGAIEAVTSAASVEVAQNMVLASMSSVSAGGVCGLDMSCCTLGAEEVLRANVTQVYQDSLHQLLRGTLPGCMNSSLPSDSVVYLEMVKASSVETMQVLWEGNYLSEFDTVFDNLFNYIEDGIVKRDLCDLEDKYQSVYFEAYLLGFKSTLLYEEKSTDLLGDPDFRSCFYDYFTEVHGATIADEYHNVKQRYNMFLRYLQALDTSDQVLETVLNHVLSPECQDSLLRMTHCAQCAGVSDSSVLPCRNLCQNVQRGCLVDIYELGYVYRRLYNALKNARDVLDQYDPFGVMQSLTAEILKMLDDFEDGSDAVASVVSTQCGVNFSSRKRSVSMPKSVIRRHSKLARRQTIDPMDTLADTVTCAKSVYRLLQNAASHVCGAHSIDSDNEQCWNGTQVGSYSSVVSGKGRLSQPANPEIELTNTTGLLYLDAIAQLKNMTAQLDECNFNVEGCAIKLCSRTVPSPSDYNLSTDSRYALFTISIEEEVPATFAVSQTPAVVRMTSITSVAPQTSAVVETPSVAVVPTTSSAVLNPTPQAPMVASTTPSTSYPSEKSTVTYISSTAGRYILKTSAAVERTYTLTSSVILQESPSPLKKDDEKVEYNGSIVTYISSTLLITSLLLTMLL